MVDLTMALFARFHVNGNWQRNTSIIQITLFLNLLMLLLIPKASKPSKQAMSEALMEEKKIKGRKRHIAVDIMGNLLGVIVHAANCHDTMTGIFPALYAHELYPTIKGFCADSGYRGTFEEEVRDWMNLPVDIVSRNEKGWKVLPKRWVVERTFAWLNNSRRLSKDYEIKTEKPYSQMSNSA